MSVLFCASHCNRRIFLGIDWSAIPVKDPRPTIMVWPEDASTEIGGRWGNIGRRISVWADDIGTNRMEGGEATAIFRQTRNFKNLWHTTVQSNPERYDFLLEQGEQRWQENFVVQNRNGSILFCGTRKPHRPRPSKTRNKRNVWSTAQASPSSMDACQRHVSHGSRLLLEKNLQINNWY